MYKTGISLPDGKTELKFDGSGTTVKDDGIVISPTAIFAIKTKMLKKETKFFINLCCHEAIDEPGEKKRLDDEGNEVNGLNIPLSVGPIRTSPDRLGNVCLAVDVVVHPSVRVDILDDKTGSHRNFVCLLLIQCVEQKYFESNGYLDRKYKLPRLHYFGYIDKDTKLAVPRASKNATICEQLVKDTRTLPKIEEVKKSPTKVNPAVTNVKDLPIKQLEIRTHVKLVNGRELTLDDFLDEMKVILKKISKNIPFDRVAQSNLAHSEYREKSNELFFPLFFNPKFSNDMVVQSIIYRATMSVVEAKQMLVEVSSYSLSIFVPNFAQTEKVFPLCVIPQSCKCIFNNASSTFELFVSVSSIDIENEFDIGSKPWLLMTALSSGETDAKKKSTKNEDQNNKSCCLYGNEQNRNDDPYQVRPGYIWNKISSDSNPETKDSTLFGSIPEDIFHSKDVVSRHLKQQQEEEFKNKKSKAGERQCEGEDNTEYLSPDDFRPGGKHYKAGNKVIGNSKGDRLKDSLVAAECVLKDNVVNPFCNNLWLQLV